jgi:hypothetical protein
MKIQVMQSKTRKVKSKFKEKWPTMYQDWRSGLSHLGWLQRSCWMIDSWYQRNITAQWTTSTLLCPGLSCRIDTNNFFLENPQDISIVKVDNRILQEEMNGVQLALTGWWDW